jgi:hypothetical protein
MVGVKPAGEAQRVLQWARQPIELFRGSSSGGIVTCNSCARVSSAAPDFAFTKAQSSSHLCKHPLSVSLLLTPLFSPSAHFRQRTPQWLVDSSGRPSTVGCQSRTDSPLLSLSPKVALTTRLTGCTLLSTGHIFGKPTKKEFCYDNLRISRNAWDTNLVKVRLPRRETLCDSASTQYADKS